MNNYLIRKWLRMTVDMKVCTNEMHIPLCWNIFSKKHWNVSAYFINLVFTMIFLCNPIFIHFKFSLSVGIFVAFRTSHQDFANFVFSDSMLFTRTCKPIGSWFYIKYSCSRPITFIIGYFTLWAIHIPDL